MAPAGRYAELARRAERAAEQELLPLLEELRLSILSLEAPAELLAALQAALEQAGLPAPASMDQAWQCIKQVWASTWSPPATRSRRSLGIPHGGLAMAVLVQEVVPADYSFVVHTVNPLDERADEIYAEVVCGLGETLVGNHPGRALAFTHPKGNGDSRLLSFPSKGRALRSGGGLIFRSDSSGEDLPGYAGAGLYASLMLPPPRSELLDYSEEPLVWDERFREELLGGIAALGRLVEKALGGPQDIEGAWAKGTFTLLQARPQVGLDRD
jgi:alpha-glucan,water dikinase